MSTRKKPPGKGTSKPAPVARVDPEVEHLLDRIDQALLTGAQTEIPALVEQLWRVRRHLPEILTQRVISGRAPIPAFTFDLLTGFGGRQAPKHLRRIAEAEQVHDIVRFGARRRAGWPQRGEAKQRRAFLDSLRDADGTLLLAVDQGTNSWPPDCDVLEEVLGYLLIVPSERRQTIIRRIAAEHGVRAAWLLHAVLHIDDPPAQRLVLSELVRLREPGAAGPITRLARTARDAEVRGEAAAAAQRLQLQVVDETPTTDRLVLPPVEVALASMVDGSGGQVLVVLRQLAEGVSIVADFLYKDDWGVKDTLGMSRATMDKVEHILNGFDEQQIELVETDLTGVRGIMAQAIEVNAATGHPIPPAFELWEPFLHDAYPPADDEAVTDIELDDTPFAGRDDLVRVSGSLADHPFFESWGFERDAMSMALIAAPPPGRSGRMTDRQYRPMIEVLLPPDECDRFRRRLRRQAWLLQQDGDDVARDLALATAAYLGRATPAELVKLPFLRALVDHSIGRMFGVIVYP